jgi:hypothetical protein
LTQLPQFAPSINSSISVGLKWLFTLRPASLAVETVMITSLKY